MTYRDDPPPTTDGVPACPRCRSVTRVEPLPHPPAHDPQATWFCAACCLSYTGKPGEAHDLAARDLAKAAARGDLDQRGRTGRELGVLTAKTNPPTVGTDQGEQP